MKYGVLVGLLSLIPFVVQAREFDVVADNEVLQQRLSSVLRGLRFPGTVGSDKVSSELDLVDLRDRLLSWKDGLESVLENASTIEFEGQELPLTNELRVYLVNRYFTLVSYFIQITKLVIGRSEWQLLADKFDLRVPPVLLSSPSSTMSALLRQVITSELRDGQAILRLKVAFVDGLQAVVLSSESTVDNHREVVKQILYSKLYRQLVQNEHYRFEKSTGYRELPVNFADTRKYGGYELDLRQAIVDYHRVDHQKILLRESLIDSYPRLETGGQKLSMPLINNWPLYEKLQATNPNLVTFTTAQMAELIYRLLSKRQREAVATANSKQFLQFMLLAEHLLLNRELAKVLQKLTIDIDGSESSLQTLRRSLINARMNALANIIGQLRINNQQRSTINVALRQRERQLLANETLMQEVGHWYGKAKLAIGDLRTRKRRTLIKELLFLSWKIDRIETSATEPVNIHILRRSLLVTSLWVKDFSGEFQQSLSAILQTNNYLAGKETFFSELSKYLGRLGQQITPRDLRGLTVDDLTNQYLTPALGRAIPTVTPASDAVHRKVNINHLAQLKSFVQYGYWFGYFATDNKKIPTIDDLPLSAAQKQSYFKELKFFYFDHYPFLLLKPYQTDQELHLTLAEAVGDRELKNIDDQELEEKFWPFIVSALDQQRDRIIDTIVRIDRADSLWDIKHLVGNSQTVNMEAKAFAGLYPLHEEFVEIYRKPSKFRHNWEKVDFEYIGGIFNVFIAQLLGGWLLRKTTLTSYPLRYITPMFGSAFIPYIKALEWAWGIILVDFFVFKPAQTFYVSPQKVNAVRDYYYLGDRRDKFFERAHLEYANMEKNYQLMNYAFESSMMGIFVGMYGFHRLFKNVRVLPYLRERRLKRDLDRLNINPKSYNTPEELGKMFSEDKIKTAAKEARKKFTDKVAEGKISKSYGDAQKKQINLARDRVLKTRERKLRMWESIKIEHHHDFATLGIEPTYRLETIDRAMKASESKKGFAYWERQHAGMQIDQSLSRLNVTIRMTEKEIDEEKINREIDQAVREFSKDSRYGKYLDRLGLARNQRSSFDHEKLKDLRIKLRNDKKIDDKEVGDALKKIDDASDELLKLQFELERFGNSYHRLMVDGLLHKEVPLHKSKSVHGLGGSLEDSPLATINKYLKREYPEYALLKKDHTEKNLKKAYRKLSLKFHPDKPSGKAEEFRQVTDAYNALLAKFNSKPKP